MTLRDSDMPDEPSFIVELFADADPVPAEIRLRKALKVLLRNYGLSARWIPAQEWRAIQAEKAEQERKAAPKAA